MFRNVRFVFAALALSSLVACAASGTAQDEQGSTGSGLSAKEKMKDQDSGSDGPDGGPTCWVENGAWVCNGEPYNPCGSIDDAGAPDVSAPDSSVWLDAG